MNNNIFKKLGLFKKKKLYFYKKLCYVILQYLPYYAVKMI